MCDVVRSYQAFNSNVLVLNETWFDMSVTSFDFANYIVVLRTDSTNLKVGWQNHVGVAVRNRVGSGLVTNIQDSAVAERPRHTVNTNLGGILC